MAGNPNARCVKARPGGHPNGGRNTPPPRGINNFDAPESKPFGFGEARSAPRSATPRTIRDARRAQSTARAVQAEAARNNLIPGHRHFDKPDQLYGSSARETHLALLRSAP